MNAVPPYTPGIHRRLFETPLGRALWSFLTEEHNRIRMHTACELGRPAIEAVEGLMLQRFGEALLTERVGPMVGHMIRQVVEVDGYLLNAKNVPLVSGGPFSRAYRYRHPEMEEFHAWQLTTDKRSLALTRQKSGCQLPTPSQGDWVYWKHYVGVLRLRVLLGVKDEAKLRDALEQPGYYLHTVERVMGEKELVAVAAAADGEVLTCPG